MRKNLSGAAYSSLTHLNTTLQLLITLRGSSELKRGKVVIY